MYRRAVALEITGVLILLLLLLHLVWTVKVLLFAFGVARCAMAFAPHHLLLCAV